MSWLSALNLKIFTCGCSLSQPFPFVMQHAWHVEWHIFCFRRFLKSGENSVLSVKNQGIGRHSTQSGFQGNFAQILGAPLEKSGGSCIKSKLRGRYEAQLIEPGAPFVTICMSGAGADWVGGIGPSNTPVSIRSVHTKFSQRPRLGIFLKFCKDLFKKKCSKRMGKKKERWRRRKMVFKKKQNDFSGKLFVYLQGQKWPKMAKNDIYRPLSQNLHLGFS